ncbi:hypothetical protein [Gulosibacter sediminis]|uniref:hypothetical protein n=1 Tax=Gulosibacter sediminis TaxID=1729695 RepID=UPI0024A9690C|nr:hypothetical protein [Gulosibacter sediminis]
MNQTPNIIPEERDTTNTTREVMRLVNERLDPDMFKIGDIGFLVRNVFEQDDEGRYRLTADFTPDDLDEAIRSIESEIDTEPGCDRFGALVRKEGHPHEASMGMVGVFEAVIVHDNETGRWLVDTYAESIAGSGGCLDAEAALDYAEALTMAAHAAQERNETRALRRPTDWAAEPQLDGRGGGL